MLLHGDGELPRLQPKREMIGRTVEWRRVGNGHGSPKLHPIPEPLDVWVVHDLSATTSSPSDVKGLWFLVRVSEHDFAPWAPCATRDGRQNFTRT
jgi:hypothetical protein